ncbi:MAG: biotin--[acetyl-CoA-carboxylase] ligase [Desulfuromonadales bacterium GWD2_61_12]|nr:MAG: biotin--[acetyl-CoA-carboxylase] ligase [Desulfuromonadales bacterium GWC2_61_20]OGR35222.1 MAG: biotin--[acetyl-CoA-carboxylase] ligase [Desulfuromonadales bacterium GWD2_61_12]HAD03216.1 biotin--[acetyl-CoA-carboxylase] ligase [Desulfuromonas sp.]HBT82482.1 biotin--[acetyl-CoA-carboxylase] ligase [Desulfuromonas sp.]
MKGKDTREGLLTLLREHRGAFVSGESISRRLGVSRSAVWKQIAQLRGAGFEVEAVPSRGYRLLLNPDLLLAAEIAAGLGTRCIGRELQCHDSIDSTNLRAWHCGETDVAEGTVVIADEQSAGKGRMGRTWTSPPGVNLYLSVLLRPDLAPRHAPQFTFLSALAVARAVEAMSGLRPTVKWPNDVLLRGHKVAGLLNEMSAETEHIHFLVLGIGVNLNMTTAQFPANLRYPATSLAQEKGSAVSRLAFCRALLRELDDLYTLFHERGFAPIREGWEGYFDLVGHGVAVEDGGSRLTGEVTGIDTDGALLLRLPGGEIERILSGDVRPLAAAALPPARGF